MMTGWELDNPQDLLGDEAYPELENFVSSYPLAALHPLRARLMLIRKTRPGLNLPPDSDNREMAELEPKARIWQFVHPGQIYLERRHRRDPVIYLMVEGNCDWEEEHGLQLVFRLGQKLTRACQYDGHLTESDAFDIPDEEDRLLWSVIGR